VYLVLEHLRPKIVINFVVVSAELRLYVLDTRMNRGAEQSTDQLVVSWIRYQGRLLDRPGKLKRVVVVNWERLVEAPVCGVFNFNHRKNFGVEPLFLRVVRSQLRWFGHLIRMTPGF